MTPEQQTPASVVEVGLPTLAYAYRLKGDAAWTLAPTCIDMGVGHWEVTPLVSGPEAANLIERLSAERERLAKALDRQADNMAFVLNHAPVGKWYDKFTAELAEDRAALTQGESRQTGVCICVARGDGPEGCGICNETGKPHPAAPTPAGGGE